MPTISQSAIDLIVAAEVSSKALYEKKYRHPEWPGEQSGVTIGIGYDVGYSNPTRLRTDWIALIPDEQINALSQCCGVRGKPAAELTARVHDKVDVPWAAAMEVFLHRDVPKWIANVCAEIAGADKLHPDCLGALVSISYNRGSFVADPDSPRRKEMQAIRRLVVAGKLDAVTDQIRGMKRLWPNSRGLRERRDAEAALWERGLKQPIPLQPKPPVKNDSPPPLVPVPTAGKAEGGSAGGVIVGGGTVAAQSSGWVAAAIIIGTIVVAVVAYAAIRWWRSQPVTARAKG